MKKSIIYLLFLFILQNAVAQKILNYKVQNTQNEKERTLMLNLVRAKLYKDYHQDFIFVVKHFKVNGNYAWLMADLKRKDGRKVKMHDWEEGACCHVEYLFKKRGSIWKIKEGGEFSTDVWWWGISQRYPRASKGIFDELGRQKY